MTEVLRLSTVIELLDCGLNCLFLRARKEELHPGLTLQVPHNVQRESNWMTVGNRWISLFPITI